MKFSFLFILRNLTEFDAFQIGRNVEYNESSKMRFLEGVKRSL